MQAKVVKYLIPALIMIAVVSLMSCGFSGKVSLDPASQNFYETARLIMTKQEKDIFHHLPDQDSREEFIRDFWAKRDPDPQTEENEFREEFFRRIDYANLRFREGIPGWKTDRGRIYIYLGPPDKVEEKPFMTYSRVKGLIWWGYYRYRLGIEFIDETGDGRYNINRHMSPLGNLLQVIERAKFGQVFGVESEFGNKFVDFDVKYHKETKEIEISIPVEPLLFEDENGLLRADFDFEFYIYEKRRGKKDKFILNRTFEKAEDEVLKLKEIVFSFPYELEHGEYYIDVVVIVKPNMCKLRKIFKLKI